MATAGTLEIEVVLNGKKAKIGLDDLKKRMGILNKSAQTANKFFGKLAKFAAIGVLAKMTMDATKFGHSMSMLADRTGIATQKLVNMRSAFSAMGVSAGSVDRLLGSITKGLAGLSMGRGDYAAKLASIGISAWGKNGKVKSADVVMGDIADWTRQQLAMGRSNAEVAAFLEEAFGIDYAMFKQLALGRGGMAQKQREMNEKTGVVDKRQIDNLKELFKSAALLKETFNVLSKRIAGDIAPILTFVANFLQLFFKELEGYFDQARKIFLMVLGDGKVVGDTFKFLKDHINEIMIPIKILIGLFYLLCEAIYAFGEWIADFQQRWSKNPVKTVTRTGLYAMPGGPLLVKAFDKFFPDEKSDGELAYESMGKKFNSPEERLKWLAGKSDTFKKMYESHLFGKQLVDENGKVIDIDSIPLRNEVFWEDGTPADIESIPLVGDEVMSAKTSGGNTIVLNIDSNTDITQSPEDGEYQIEQTYNVSDGTTNISNILFNVATSGGTE